MQRSLSPQPDDSTVDQRPQDRRVGDEKLAILRFDVGALDQLWYAKMPRRTGRARQMRGMLLRDEVRARPALPFEGGGLAGKRAFVIPHLVSHRRDVQRHHGLVESGRSLSTNCSRTSIACWCSPASTRSEA